MTKLSIDQGPLEEKKNKTEAKPKKIQGKNERNKFHGYKDKEIKLIYIIHNCNLLSMYSRKQQVYLFTLKYKISSHCLAFNNYNPHFFLAMY